MTYLIEFVKNLKKKSNVGILLYFILNIFIITSIFSSNFKNMDGILTGLILYTISLAIALSPIGERILRFQTGCKEIKREEYKKKIEPLFREVYQEAKKHNPSISDDIKLYMSGDEYASAFATGRKTICITKGFLKYPDEYIKATLAHEFGHLSNKDTDFILLISVGNLIVTALFIIYRIIVAILAFLASIVIGDSVEILVAFLIDIVLAAMMWIWTKIGIILVMYSSRKNEFLADKFSYDCGYGEGLAQVLDQFYETGAKGLWANLISSHPSLDERIAKLQEYGIEYRNGTI
ncbi:MAG TPA: hypothetical protein DCM73_01535 [Clostridiales bacterium]|nr:hypothetical protein [Clostridiales bacterium]